MLLPGGTITFLFTVIEGSTRLWEQHSEAMRSALARHDALMRQAIEDNNGAVFKTMGDAFYAAFPTAPEALTAALAVQKALSLEVWPDAVTIKTRMALHTGAVELRDNDYFGPPLNRVARLLAAGHGGQTLISTVTQELVRDALPPSCSLRSLGEHRLRDLNRPEQVFQLVHPALPSEYPPLKSLDHPDLPNNLPQQVTSFIGREKEIAEVKLLLSKTRLLTLAGSGGCGKTRLALQAAAELVEHYPEGVWLVELAPLADPALVVQSIAQTLGVSEEPGRPLLQTLAAALKPRRLLLVLDNCEHLLESCAQVANTLLHACPHVKILASSREGLGIAGETVYRIPSLSLPDLKQTATPASLDTAEAVRLFIDRALAALPSFAVTNANAPALASVCCRLDGIPLAIELAAARVRSLSMEEINNKLDDRFRLLTGGSRTALPRQQTLRALIDWSYDLLTAPEKALLCRLSVFAGGWTLKAAEAVGVGPEAEEWEALDLLMGLIDKSLVVSDIGAEQTRYRLLETVRQYARDRLMERGESAEARGRHQAYFLSLAETAESQLSGPDQLAGLNRLESEHDNLRAALGWENREAALRIAGALFLLWNTRGFFTEGRMWLTETLATAASDRSAARARALRAAGVLARRQDDLAAAQALNEQGLALYRELKDMRGIVSSLVALGNIAVNRIDYALARSLFEQSLALAQELGDKKNIGVSLASLAQVVFRQGDTLVARSLLEQSLALHRESGVKSSIGNSLVNLGTVAMTQEDFAAAQAFLEESLALHRELGDQRAIALSLTNLAAVAQNQRDLTTAQPLYAQSLALYRALEDRSGTALVLYSLSGIAIEQDRYADARALLQESMALFQELGDTHRIACAFDYFAALALAQGQFYRAAIAWGASETLRVAIGSPRTPLERKEYEIYRTLAQSSLGESALGEALAEGRAMTMEQAIAYVLAGDQK